MVEIGSSQVGSGGASCQLGVLMKRVQRELFRGGASILQRDATLTAPPFTHRCVNIERINCYYGTLSHLNDIVCHC